MNFIKLVAKFVIIFTVLTWTILGTVYASYKFLKGDFNLSNPISKITNKYISKKDPINGLILGTDKSGMLTDVILFVHYDPNTYKINIISVPRDTLITGDRNRKINSLYSIGKEKMVIDTVEKILNTKIKYYAMVNLKGFREIVDSIGGIPIDVPQDMKYYDPYQNLNINISKGPQTLNGSNAEGFVRYREGYVNGDLGRIKAQQLFIKAAMAQVLKPQNIIKIPSLVNIVLSNVKTNMPKTEILSYIGDVTKISKDNIMMNSLPGEPKYIDGISYFICDNNKAREMIDNMNYNESEINEKDAFGRNKTYSIDVLNGTDIPGLALKVATKLKQSGFNIVNVGNGDKTEKETQIIERNDRNGGKYIKSITKVGAISENIDENTDVDMTIIVGQDYKDN